VAEADTGGWAPGDAAGLARAGPPETGQPGRGQLGRGSRRDSGRRGVLARGFAESYANSMNPAQGRVCRGPRW